MLKQQITLATLSQKSPEILMENPQEYYLWLILNALDAHYDDLADMENMVASLETAITIIKSDITTILK